MQSISSKNIYPFNCKRGVKPLKVYKVQPAPKEKRKAKRGLSDADFLIPISPLEHPCRRYAPKKILENKAPPPETTPAPKGVRSSATVIRYDLSNSSATFEES